MPLCEVVQNFGSLLRFILPGKKEHSMLKIYTNILIFTQDVF